MGQNLRQARNREVQIQRPWHILHVKIYHTVARAADDPQANHYGKVYCCATLAKAIWSHHRCGNFYNFVSFFVRILRTIAYGASTGGVSKLRLGGPSVSQGHCVPLNSIMHWLLWEYFIKSDWLRFIRSNDPEVRRLPNSSHRSVHIGHSLALG